MSILIESAVALVLVASLAHTETSATDHGMMMAVPEGASEATRGYVEAMNRMAMVMAVKFTGDADRDFIIGMIPHHQGALDAASLVSALGSYFEVRSFAQAVIAAQE